MNHASIQLRDDKIEYQPDDTIAGTATWELSRAPADAEVRLFWFTDCPGGSEAQIVDRCVFHAPGPRGREHFSFRLPATPPSFFGHLFAIKWAVELVFEPRAEKATAVFVCGPNRTAIFADPAARAAEEFAEDQPGH